MKRKLHTLHQSPERLGYLVLLTPLGFIYPPLALFGLFGFAFWIPLLRAMVSPTLNKKVGDETTVAEQRFGWLLFLSTNLNPCVVAQSLLQQFGQVVVYGRYGRNLPSPQTYQQQVHYTVPFRGNWLVVNGGPDEETSHSWELVTQRYAYDFVKIDESGNSHRDKGTSLEDYYAYGTDIIAPADGQVVRVRDGVRDSVALTEGRIDWLTDDFRGNFVVIQHAPHEYSFLTHLVPRSITVKPGEVVERGQFIGLCGNSGHSTEPHLHFHVQDRANIFFAAGLPVKMSHYQYRPSSQGQPTVQACGYLVRNTEVAPVERCAEPKTSLCHDLAGV